MPYKPGRPKRSERGREPLPWANGQMPGVLSGPRRDQNWVMAHLFDDRSESGHILWVGHDTMDDARDWGTLPHGEVVGPVFYDEHGRMRPVFYERNNYNESDEWVPDPGRRGRPQDATKVAWSMAVEGLYLPDISTQDRARQPLDSWEDLERTCDYPVCMNLDHLQHVPRLPAPQRILELVKRPGEDALDLRSLPPGQQPCWLWVGPLDGGGRPTAAFYGRTRSGEWWVWVAVNGWHDSMARQDIARQEWCSTELCVNPAHHRETGKGGVRPGAGRPPARWCKYGHTYTPENSRYIRRSDGSIRSKFCKTCDQARRPRSFPQLPRASRNFPGIVGDDSLLGGPPTVVGQGAALRGDRTILELEEME